MPKPLTSKKIKTRICHSLISMAVRGYATDCALGGDQLYVMRKNGCRIPKKVLRAKRRSCARR